MCCRVPITLCSIIRRFEFIVTEFWNDLNQPTLIVIFRVYTEQTELKMRDQAGD